MPHAVLGILDIEWIAGPPSLLILHGRVSIYDRHVVATRDVHTLFPPSPACDYMASLDKRDFADVIKVRNLEKRYPGGPA